MAELKLTFSQTDPKNKNTLINVSYFNKDELIDESKGHPFHFTMESSKYEDLRWYIEDYPAFPDDESIVRVQQIEQWVNEIGRDIYSAIFFHLDNQKLFDLFRKDDSPHLITIATDNNDILQLPWELITNKKCPLAQQKISLRRQINKSKPVKIKPDRLPIRLLLVVSRPDDAINPFYHHSTQAISSALLSMSKDVVIDYCNPPSLDRITEQLAMAKDINQPYHIVHFDGYSNYDTASNKATMWLENTDTRNPLKTKSDSIHVEKLGDVLHKNSVPLFILETGCSDRTKNTILPSAIASRLLESGVTNLISMSNSLSLRAGTVFFKNFFKNILEQKTIGQAVNRGRISLLSLTDRKNSLYPGDTTIYLNGWFVPQLYQNSKDMPLIQVKKARAEQSIREARKNLAQTSETGAFPPSTTYEFIGREHEMYTLAKLLNHKNATVIHSSHGSGKTTFICKAAEWLTQSGNFPDGACYCNFERPMTVELIIQIIGCYMEGLSFNVLSGQKQLEKVRKYFLKKKVMIVFDNFDYVFSTGAKGEKGLYEGEEKKRIMDLVSDWSVLPRCKGRIVIMSSVKQTPLKNVNIYELKGLERSDSLSHLLQVMSGQSISFSGQYPQKSVFNNLLAVLKDNPLLIELVVRNLESMNPGKIVDEINSIADTLNKTINNYTDKTITAVLYFYILHLPSDVREVIKWLGLFQRGVFEDIFLKISGFGEDKWTDIRNELQAVSLIKTDHTFSLAGRPFLHIHPTLYSVAEIITNPLKEYFSETILQGNGMYLDKEPEIQKRYMGIYYSLNVMLKKALKGVTERIAMDTLALEELNIKKAIFWTIENQGFKVAVWMCDTLSEYLSKANRTRERDKWVSYLTTLEKKQASHKKMEDTKKKEYEKQNKVSDEKTVSQTETEGEKPDSSSETGTKEKVRNLKTQDKSYSGPERRINSPDTPFRGIEKRTTILDSKKKKSKLTVKDSEERIEFAWTLFADGKINESIELLENLDNQLKENVSFNPDFQRAKTRLTLGRIYYTTDKVSESIDILTENSREWKKIVNRAKETRKNSKAGLINLTANLCSLTNALIAAGQYEDALKNAYEAHKIDKELKNEKNIVTGYFQIAQILTCLNRYQEAETTYKQALDLVERIGDNELKGNILQHQGILTESMGKTGIAKEILQQAIEIFNETNNDESIFQTYNLLAEFEEKTQKIDNARKWYNRSLKIAKNRNDSRSYASIKQKIGMLYQVEGESELKNSDHNAAIVLFNKAKQLIGESLTIKKELLDEPGQADSLALIAQLNLFTGNLDQAESYANQARAIDEKIGSEAVSFDYYILSEIEKERGNDEKAREWEIKLKALEKSVKS